LLVDTLTLHIRGKAAQRTIGSGRDDLLPAGRFPQ
jgi:hypothetical protein